MREVLGSRDECELMAKLVKLVKELQAGEATEVEFARIERNELVGLFDLGLRLAEAKQARTNERLNFVAQAPIKTIIDQNLSRKRWDGCDHLRF
jgi:hypothetical protein